MDFELRTVLEEVPHHRLAGSIDDVVAIDADVFAKDLVSVVSPNRDYPSFWRSLMRFVHEISQNGMVVAYFGMTLPEQVLANRFSMPYFSAVHFLGLVCDESDPSVPHPLAARRRARWPTG